MPQSPWPDYYCRYRQLKSDWRVPGVPPEVDDQIFQSVLTGRNPPRSYFKGPGKTRYGEPPPEVWEEALELRGVIGAIPSGWSEQEPLEDVYQAALRMETYFGSWDGSTERYQLFRGQRNHAWDVIPAVFRPDRAKIGAGDAVAADSENKLRKICGLVRALQASGAAFTDEEGVAIVQHYSADLKMGTWLLDYTWDPFVALFFASDKGTSDNIGVVSYVSLSEWSDMSVDGTNRMGALRVIEPKGVPRMAAQHAAFLDTSHPELFRLYVPHSLYFRQTTGMVFEDELRHPPVSERKLYPPSDELLPKLLALTPPPGEKPLSCRPGADPRQPLTAGDYFQLVTSWLRRDGTELTDDKERVLKRVCDAFAGMQRPGARETIPITSRSLHRLEQMMRSVTVNDCSTPDEIMRFELQGRFPEPAKKIIRGLFNWV